MNARPALEIAKDQIHRIRNLRHEVIDISIPVAIVSGGEKQLRVVVQKYEAHIVKSANGISTAKVTFERLQQSAQSLRPTWCERNDPREFRDLALTGANTAGVLCSCRSGQLSFEVGETSLQRRSAQFGRIGIKLTQLLHFLLDPRVFFRSDRHSCLWLHCVLP